MTTPYFVPEPFLSAIRTAVQRAWTWLVLSLHSNQMFTIFAQRSFYDELLDARVRSSSTGPASCTRRASLIDDDRDHWVEQHRHPLLCPSTRRPVC